MFGEIVAFLAVATTAALANPCGSCYPGYGSYVNAVPALTTGFYGSGVLSTGCASPMVAGVASSVPFTAVGVPEVSSSCENNAIVAGGVSAPVVSSGVLSSGVVSPFVSSGVLSPVVSTGVVSPVVSSGVVSPVVSTGVVSPVVSGVVSPVVSTGIVSPVVSSGLISTGVLSSGYGCGCGRRIVATSF